MSLHKEQKKELEEHPAQVFSCEFGGIFKNNFFKEHLRWLLLKINTTKPNYCTQHPDWTNVIFKWFVMNYFGNLSKWTHSNITLSQAIYSNQTKLNGKFHFCIPFEKGNISLEGSTIALNVPPQLLHWYFENYIPLSHLHYIHHTKYMQKVDKPMIHVMIGSEADIRELI